MKRFSNVLWGLVIIALGIILGGNALGITDIHVFFDGWWTLFIIVPCAIGLFSERDKTGNLIGLLIGAVLLLSCQDMLSFRIIWKLAFPAILIIIGCSIICKDALHRKVNDDIRKRNSERGDTHEYCATFSGQDVKFDDTEFQGATLTAVFGGIECDLRNAIFAEDQVVNCTAIFGGVDLHVPANVKIQVKSTSIFGGVSKPKFATADADAKILYVNATCIFGGVDIK